MEKKFSRDTTYRSRFFKKHKGFMGFYTCCYCGKILTHKTLAVDHLIPVDKAKKTFWCKVLFAGKSNGINTTSNLYPSCYKCNQKKSNKIGLWPIRGVVGNFMFPILWILLVSIILSVIATYPYETIALISAIVNNVFYSIKSLFDLFLN